MKLKDKIRSFCTFRKNPYSPEVDRFLATIMKEGEAFEIPLRFFSVGVKLFGHTFELSFSRSEVNDCFTRCDLDEENCYKSVWSDARPSRSMYIKCYEWVEQKVPRLAMTHQALNELNIASMLQKLKAEQEG